LCVLDDDDEDIRFDKAEFPFRYCGNFCFYRLGMGKIGPT